MAVSGCLGSPSIPGGGEDDKSSTQTPRPTRTSTTRPTATEQSPSTLEATDRTVVGFGGDTMVGRDLDDVYGKDGVDPASIWGDLHQRLQELDAVCCNLECCLSKKGERFPDRSYYFRGDPEWAVPALGAGNVQFASLANNHVMDYGADALVDTIDHLSVADITVAGAGETVDAAREPATFSVNGLDFAAVSVSEHAKEYAATADSPGIAYAVADRKNERTRWVVSDMLERAKSTDPDVLVVSVHWGENWTERPTNRHVDFGHWLVDQGVDIVHGHSAHVVQAVEQYGDGLVLHDTGNFVDDFGVVNRVQNDESFLFEVALDGDELGSVRLVPTHIDKGVSRADEEQAAWLRETMRERSDPFETTYRRDDDDGLVVDL